MIFFKDISADQLAIFSFRCASCTKLRRCAVRIELRGVSLFGSPAFPDALHVDPKTTALSCDNFRKSNRKTPDELQSKRYLRKKSNLEAKGQLCLFDFK